MKLRDVIAPYSAATIAVTFPVKVYLGLSLRGMVDNDIVMLADLNI